MTDSIKELVFKELGCEPPVIPGWRILIKAYIRQEVFKEITRNDGSKVDFLLSSKTTEEDKYRTIVGRVVAMGNLCYNEARFYDEPWCKVGDWVVFSPSNGKLRYHNNHPCYLLDDDKIDYVVFDPTIAIRDK